MKKTKRSILEAFHGALLEKADVEFERVLANIDDLNTNPIKKRSITITIELHPTNDRKKIRLLANAKSKIEPTAPIETTLFTVQEVDKETGEAYRELHEVMEQAPGQLNLDGEITEQEIILIGTTNRYNKDAQA